jgi:hypothetical protein
VATIKGARQASGQTNFRAASTIDFTDLGASSVLYAAYHVSSVRVHEAHVQLSWMLAAGNVLKPVEN